MGKVGRGKGSSDGYGLVDHLATLIVSDVSVNAVRIACKPRYRKECGSLHDDDRLVPRIGGVYLAGRLENDTRPV